MKDLTNCNNSKEKNSRINIKYEAIITYNNKIINDKSLSKRKDFPKANIIKNNGKYLFLILYIFITFTKFSLYQNEIISSNNFINLTIKGEGSTKILKIIPNSPYNKPSEIFINGTAIDFKIIEDKNNYMIDNGSEIYSLDYYVEIETNIQKNVIVKWNNTVNNLYKMFYGITSLISIDLSSFDTSSVTNMFSMFCRCSLKSLDLINLNLSSLKSMSAMFSFSSLESLNLCNLNTKSLIDMRYMFENCTSLKFLNIKNVDTSSVTDMTEIFHHCTQLKALNLSNLNFSSLKIMKKMFSYSAIESLNLNNLYTKNLSDISSMFEGCSSLTYFNFNNFDISTVTSINKIFYLCSSLKNLDLNSCNTSSVLDMSYMFSHCSSLKSLDLSFFNTMSVLNMSYMFDQCSSLKSLDLSSFNTMSVLDMSYMFNQCSSLESLNISNFNTSLVLNMEGMFNGSNLLKYLDLKNFNTSSVQKMNFLFAFCSSLISFDLSAFDTSNVIKMNGIFAECSSLTSLDMRNFITSNVIDMSGMFCGCSSLISLDLSNFNSTSVIYMTGMFSMINLIELFEQGSVDYYYIFYNDTVLSNSFFNSSLISLDIHSLDTSSVIDMSFMFSSCTSLISLNIHNFNTSSVHNLACMFCGCKSLISLDLRNFIANHDYEYGREIFISMAYMFEGCSSLISIDLSNFNHSNLLLDHMFFNCKGLEFINIRNLEQLYESSNPLENKMLYGDMFYGTPDFLVYCIKKNENNLDKIKMQLLSKKCAVEYCLDDWKSKKKKLINKVDVCIENCEIISNYEYNNICYPKCPEGTKSSHENEYLCQLFPSWCNIFKLGEFFFLLFSLFNFILYK